MINKVMKSVDYNIKDLAGKAIKASPKVVSTGKKIINAVKPAVQFIPGLSNYVNNIAVKKSYNVNINYNSIILFIFILFMLR